VALAPISCSSSLSSLTPTPKVRAIDLQRAILPRTLLIPGDTKRSVGSTGRDDVPIDVGVSRCLKRWGICEMMILPGRHPRAPPTASLSQAGIMTARGSQGAVWVLLHCVIQERRSQLGAIYVYFLRLFPGGAEASRVAAYNQPYVNRFARERDSLTCSFQGK
jgi:hypothetical protein